VCLILVVKELIFLSGDRIRAVQGTKSPAPGPGMEKSIPLINLRKKTAETLFFDLFNVKTGEELPP
jgi:hypothetical protein